MEGKGKMLCSLDKLPCVCLSRTSLYMTYWCAAPALEACLVRWAHEAEGEVVVHIFLLRLQKIVSCCLSTRIRDTAVGSVAEGLEGCAVPVSPPHARKRAAPRARATKHSRLHSYWSTDTYSSASRPHRLDTVTYADHTKGYRLGRLCRSASLTTARSELVTECQTMPRLSLQVEMNTLLVNGDIMLRLGSFSVWLRTQPVIFTGGID